MRIEAGGVSESALAADSRRQSFGANVQLPLCSFENPEFEIFRVRWPDHAIRKEDSKRIKRKCIVLMELNDSEASGKVTGRNGDHLFSMT